MKKLLLSLLFTIFICQSSFAQFFKDEAIKNIELDYWSLTNNRNVNLDSVFISQNDIYKILNTNGNIPYPFEYSNEENLKWIDSCSWEFNSKFILSEENLKSNNINIILEGVNTFSKLYINNIFIDSTYNEFYTYKFDIKPFLKLGNNDLKLIIEPSIDRLNYKSELYNTLESEKRVINRNNQYRYGWDWYPKMLSVGFKTINIELYNVPRIEFANIQTLSVENNIAEMVLNIGISSLTDDEYELRLSERIETSGSFILTKESHIEKPYTFSFSKKDIDKDLGCFSFKFNVDNPYLWYIKEMGEQNIYENCIELYKKEKDTSIFLYYEAIDFGIRTIELVQEKDSIGQSFYFKLNGKPFFAKGANIIIDNNLNNRIFNYAEEANFNLIRIWGGSEYANEDFYKACDRKGILVWQDFPFACALYPGDNAFIDNVRKEAEQNIKKIAGHPSLALFCGNNEIWEGWMNWGWKQEVEDTIKAVENYNNLFNKLLPELVNKYSPTINYIHTSPLHGWGRKESLTHGDCHYWGVWWADSTLETYTRKVPRFMSEFGFQGAPNINTAKAYMSLPYSKENQDFAIHQKHPRGFELIDNRINEYFNSYETDEDYIYKSQVVQQEAYKIAIEAQRRAKPYCMGTLFWQLNDAYPAISWSAIDYSGYKKPVYYTIKKAFEPIILSIDNISNKDSVFVYYCNDIDSNYNMNFFASVYNNKGQKLISIEIKKLNIKANLSEKILSICLKDINGFNPKTDYIYVEGKINDLLIDNHSFFVKPKDYVKTNSKPKIIKIKKGEELGTYMKSKNVIRNVVFEEIDHHSYLENMIMDILPHKRNKISDYVYSKFNIKKILQ
ncbi:MAG: sugar-binding domain-containing protein [Bacteroidales bacterium]